MSNRAKHKLYRAFSVLCILGALLGVVICCCAAFPFVFKKDPAERDYSYVWAFGFFVGFVFLLPVSTLAHELGHLLFGKLAGLQFASMRVSFFRLQKIGKHFSLRFVRLRDAAGSFEMYPKSEKGIRGKMIFCSLGGPLFSLIYGGASLACFCILPMHPVLYFFALFSPLALLEAVLSLYPIETDSGKTDGEVVLSLLKKTPSAMVALRVLGAQGILTKGLYSDLSEEFLFDVPVVREDDIAFLALTQLRFQYLFYVGREEEALRQLFRLEELIDYLGEAERAEVGCDLLYAYSVLCPDLERAEAIYFPLAMGARGTTAYLRAVAAYTAARGEKGSAALRKQAREAAEEEALRGVSALELKFLEKIPLGNAEQNETSAN